MSDDSFLALALAIAILPILYRKLIIPMLGAGPIISIGPSGSGCNETRKRNMCRRQRWAKITIFDLDLLDHLIDLDLLCDLDHKQ